MQNRKKSKAGHLIRYWALVSFQPPSSVGWYSYLVSWEFIMIWVGHRFTGRACVERYVVFFFFFFNLRVIIILFIAFLKRFWAKLYTTFDRGHSQHLHHVRWRFSRNECVRKPFFGPMTTAKWMHIRLQH